MAVQFTFSLAILVVVALNGAVAFQMAKTSQRDATILDAVSRRDVFAASASTAFLAGVPMEALAAKAPKAKFEKEVAAKFYFNGVFRDLKHPEGYRVVAGAVNKPGTVTLQDEADGKVFEIPMMAMKDEETGKMTVEMDLSKYQKKFPSNVVATVLKDGCLKFPDGNIWQKEKGVVGCYIDGFAPYPKFRRIVLPVKGVAPKPGDNVSITMVSGKKVFDANGIDLGKGGLKASFPGNKECTGRVNSKLGTITWQDGNVWTKV